MLLANQFPVILFIKKSPLANVGNILYHSSMLHTLQYICTCEKQKNRFAAIIDSFGQRVFILRQKWWEKGFREINYINKIVIGREKDQIETDRNENSNVSCVQIVNQSD